MLPLPNLRASPTTSLPSSLPIQQTLSIVSDGGSLLSVLPSHRSSARKSCMTVSLLRSRIKRAAGNKLERNHFLSNRHVLLTAKTARHGGISSSRARTFRYRPSFSRSFSLGILRDSNVSKRSYQPQHQTAYSTAAKSSYSEIRSLSSFTAQLSIDKLS